jgi:multiple sugar transport system substrate-binding protein
MKKLLVIFLVLLIPAAIVFAGGGSQGGAAASSGGGGKVEFWDDKPNAEVDPQFSAELTKASGVPVEIIAYTDVSSYQTALQQSIRQPTAPGMFTWWSGFQLQALVENNLLEDLTSIWQTHIIPNGVSPDVAEALKFNGKIYAAPWALLNNTIIYNKKVFDRLGIKEPATWEEFVSNCAKIKAAGIYPIGHHNASWGSFVWLQIMLGSYDPQLYLDICSGKEKYTGDKMKAAMRVWDDLLNKGYFADPIEESGRAFANEEIAMLNGTTADPVGLTRDFGLQPGSDYDTFVVPSQKVGGKRIIFFEVSPLCISANSAQKPQALEVLKHYYELAPQQFFSDNVGYVNSSKVAIKNSVTAKQYAFGADSSKYQSILRFYENTPSELRDVVIDEMHRVWLRQGTLDQVLAACQVKADATFK